MVDGRGTAGAEDPERGTKRPLGRPTFPEDRVDTTTGERGLDGPTGARIGLAGGVRRTDCVDLDDFRPGMGEAATKPKEFDDTRSPKVDANPADISGNPGCDAALSTTRPRADEGLDFLAELESSAEEASERKTRGEVMALRPDDLTF